ncbi:MAG: hypothetical protein ABIM99_00100 [Candidatus Dojkabacteria bacterium]
MYFIHLEKEDDSSPLSLEQWISIIKKDPEMIYSNIVSYVSPFGENITKSGGFYGIWRPKNEPNIEVVFTYHDGVISAIYDSKILRKLQEISEKIDGFVYGDNEEEY